VSEASSITGLLAVSRAIRRLIVATLYDILCRIDNQRIRTVERLLQEGSNFASSYIRGSVFLSEMPPNAYSFIGINSGISKL